ncbi:MAG TPA: DEAD/DEAH box helicase family protein [Polyangiaceae bacterium]|nr:DEAD/DEAH box helicase family protein [Polyangiaceae bacterium]
MAYALRPYQRAALDRLAALVRGGARRVLLASPTGSGKTVLAVALIADALARGERVLFLAHRRELVVQTFDKLRAHGVPERSVGVFMGRDPRWRPGAPVQVASVDTLRNRPKPPADLVFVDEAHRALAKSYRDLAAHYAGALQLGLTATPYRADNRPLADAYDELVVVASVRELIAQGHLVEPRVFTVPASRAPDLTGVRVRGGDYDASELARAVDREGLVGDIVEHWGRLARGVRTVAFAASVEHSRHVVARFRAAGVPAEHLDGETPTPERDAILARVDRGETLVVSNCGVLTEGWDCLDAKTEVLAPSGWKAMGEVARGDEVYALDPATGLLEVVPALDVGVRDTRPGESMFRLRSQHVDIRTTVGHRFYVKTRPDPDAPFEVVTGEELARRRRCYTLPLAAPLGSPPSGAPLTDDELRFVAWFMTDGGFQRNRCAVGISQSKAFHNEIRALLGRLELDYVERVRAPQGTTYGSKLTLHEFFVAKGTGAGSLARRGWLERFGPYLDKNVSPLLHRLTREQFLVFWKELLKGDGEQLDKSGWLWCDRKEQVDAYTHMAAVRGFASAYSERVTKKGKTVYRVSVRDRAWITSNPNDPRAARRSLEEPAVEERVWCVTNRHGTLVTRRGGRIAILGNCPPVKACVLARPTKSLGLYLQQAGRILRPWNGVGAVLLDHAGCALEHGLPQDDRDLTLRPKRKRSAPGEAPVKACPACDRVLPTGAPRCPECGHVFFARRTPEEGEGELVEVTARPTPTDAEKRAAYAQFLAIAARKGLREGWAYYRFKERYGEGPPHAVVPEARPRLATEADRRAYFEKLLAEEPSEAWATARFWAEAGRPPPAAPAGARPEGEAGPGAAPAPP